MQQQEPANSQETTSSIRDWRDRKFSMFIHFGIYSVPGGVWNGKPVTVGYSEQIRSHGKIPKEEYNKLTTRFNPTAWNPDAVVTLAKNAGMKSIVITSKHHDGFAMYHTKYSPFNVVDATPYKRDIVKELAEACQKQGIKFGVYFSLIDWDFPGALPISSHNSDSIPPKHHQLNLSQVEELVTNYGPISEIWFDMSKPTLKQSQEIAAMVKKHQPGCLISGRIWNDMGDFAVMGDNVSPDFVMGTDWQTPASMFDETWSYRSWQERGSAREKAAEKTAALANVVSNGGNYLLNIGPMGDGSLVPFERDVLLAMGDWLTQNGEAIYGSTTTRLPAQDWGVITSKPQQLFLFVTKPPRNGELIVKGLRSKPSKAYHLGNPSVTVPFTAGATECRVNLQGLSVSELLTVIVLEYDGALDYIPSNIATAPYVLNTANATSFHSLSGQDYYTTKPTVIRREWYIELTNSSNYKLIISSPPKDKGRRFIITVNDEKIPVVLEGKTNQLLKKAVLLEADKIGVIQLSLADQSNVHRDIAADGLVIRLEK